jgi:hypothetical protein
VARRSNVSALREGEADGDTEHMMSKSSFRVPRRNEKGQFLRGEGGRPPGSRNKLSKAFIAGLCADWIEHGSTVIKTVREKRPDAYLKVVASLLPKQLDIEDDAFDGLTDEQLAALIAYSRAALGIGEDSDGEAKATAH